MRGKKDTARKFSNSEIKRDNIRVFVTAFFIGFFVMLILKRTFFNKYPDIIIISLTGLSVVIIMFFIMLWRKERRMFLIPLIISAILTAAAMTFFSLHPGTDHIVYPAIMFFFSFNYLQHDDNYWITVHSVFEHIILISLPIFILNLACLSMLRDYSLPIIVMPLFLLLIIAITITNSLNTCGRRLINQKSVISAIISRLVDSRLALLFQIMIFAAMFAMHRIDNDNTIKSLFDIVITFLIIWALMPDINEIFEELVKAEDAVSSSRYEETRSYNSILEESLGNKRFYTYLKIISLCLGTGLLLLFAPARYIEIQKVDFKVSVDPQRLVLIIVFSLLMALALLALLISIIWHTNKETVIRKQNSCRWGITVIFTMMYILNFIIMLLLNYPYKLTFNPVNICAVFQIIGCSLLIGESFYSNIYRIRVINYRKDYIVDSLVIIGGSILTLIFTIMPSEGPTFAVAKGTLNISSVCIGLVSNIFVTILLPTSLFCIIHPEYQNRDKAVLEKIPGEIAKNGLLAVLIAFVAGTMPNIIISVNDNYSDAAFGIITTLFPIYLAVSFCTKNNVVHLSKREKEVERSIESMNEDEVRFHKRRLKSLEQHLRCQNAIALFSLLLYCIVPLIGLYLRKGKNFLSAFKSTYYPSLRNKWE